MTNSARHDDAGHARKVEAPRPTPQFRRRSWLDFQRALDPLAAPKPLRRPRLQ